MIKEGKERTEAPLVYCSHVILKGQLVEFAVWPGLDLRFGEYRAWDITEYLRDSVSEKPISLFMHIPIDQAELLGEERPVAVLKQNDHGKLFVSQPEEAEEDELLLLNAFAEYLQNPPQNPRTNIYLRAFLHSL